MSGDRRPPLIRGTPQELARIQAVEQATGINIGDFMHEMAETDPFDKTGRCIFCKAAEPEHGAGCLWIELRETVLRG